MATDTTGKRIYFVYAQKSLRSGALSLRAGDKHLFATSTNISNASASPTAVKIRGAGKNSPFDEPLVNFETAPAPSVRWDFRKAQTSEESSFTSGSPDDVQFDLVHVEDANHQGPQYVYYSKDNWVLPDAATSPTTSTYLPDRQVDA